MKHFYYALALALLGCMPTCGQTLGQSVKWDSQSLFFDGKRVVPVMGEIHYSRIPADEWRQELQKMKAGGVTMIANYVFWNHVEEEEGIFNWSGQRSLRHFLELCKEEGLPVVLRIGPFCHGEVRGGGIPDWIVARKDIQLRTEDPKFLHYIEALYRQIYTQAQGLLWKDGGPVVACQFDNEYGGEGSYLVALKRIAQKIGFDLPFYTRTGWPELKSPVPYGEMIPLYGDYADGQYTHLFGYFCHNRACTCPCAASHRGGDKCHLSAVVEQVVYVIQAVIGYLLSFIRITACAQSGSYLQLLWDSGLHEHLSVGVAQSEVHVFDAFLIHVIDSVATATTHTDYLDEAINCLVVIVKAYHILIVHNSLSSCRLLISCVFFFAEQFFD